MSKRTVRTPFHAGDHLVSERTARRARTHPRTVAVPDAAAALAPAANAGLAARRDAPRPAGEAKILRRWSIAALIAFAPRSRVVA